MDGKGERGGGEYSVTLFGTLMNAVCMSYVILCQALKNLVKGIQSNINFISLIWQ